MNSKISENQKFDPWESKQDITNPAITILSSRYTILSAWECENLIAPFWRIYHSRNTGSYIIFNGQTIEINPDKLTIVSPQTSFSCFINDKRAIHEEKIKSEQITDETQLENYVKLGMVDQMYVHFSLGFPFDRVKPFVYQIELSDTLKELLHEIQNRLILNPIKIDFNSSTYIKALTLLTLNQLPSDLWNIPKIDSRVSNVLAFISENISQPISNLELSNLAYLEKNSFARLFKENMNCSIQTYIQQKRIDKAINLFHHTNIQIEDVALSCGFYDRYHFSRIFKKVTGYSPVNFRNKIQ